jgi:hypothetical protein
MSKITVARNGEEIGTYTKIELEHLASSRFLQPDDHYWTEGMPEWRLLRELVPDSALAVRIPAVPVPLTPVRPARIEPVPNMPAQYAQPQQPLVVNVVNNNVASVTAPRTIVVGTRKSGLVAAFLNILIPGLGYMYCGRVLLGMMVFIITVVVIIGTAGIGALVMYPILILDGFLCAGRANRRIILIQ